MRLLKVLIAACFVASMSLAVVGCERKGPAEKIGESVDEAAEDAGKAVRDIEIETN